MNRRILIVFIIVVSLVAAGAVTYYFIKGQSSGREKSRDDHSTNANYSFEDGFPSADPAMVGKWQNVDNPQWYKVYYDDYDDDGFFWGKEWSEDEDVFEEDLPYHGNGWYRWRKNGKALEERHVMSIRDVPIKKQWRVKAMPDSLVLLDPETRKPRYSFRRVE